MASSSRNLSLSTLLWDGLPKSMKCPKDKALGSPRYIKSCLRDGLTIPSCSYPGDPWPLDVGRVEVASKSSPAALLMYVLYTYIYMYIYIYTHIIYVNISVSNVLT